MVLDSNQSEGTNGRRCGTVPRYPNGVKNTSTGRLSMTTNAGQPHGGAHRSPTIRSRRQRIYSSVPRSTQDCDGEVDDQPGDVDERRDERRRRGRRIEPEPAQDERQQRADERAPQDDADERERHGDRHEQPVRAVDGRERRPDGDAQEADRARGCRRAPDPAAISRRMTRHQSRKRHLAQRERADDERRRLRSGVAAARDDERDEQREHDRALDLGLEGAHRRRGEHLAEEQRREPAGALLDHPAERDDHVGLVEGFRAADPLDVLGGRASETSSTSSMVTMPISTPVGVGDRQRRAVVLPELRDRGGLVVGGLQRDEAPIHQVATRGSSGAPAGTHGCGCRRSSMPCSSTT